MSKVDVTKISKRQKIAMVGILVVLLVITGVIMWQTRTDNNVSRFELSSIVYEKEGLEEITAETYEKLLADHESFLVLAHNTACPAGMPLTSVVRDLTHEYGMTVYGLIQDQFKASSLAESVQFLPSLAIVRDGRVITYLKADSDADMPAYQSVEGLKNWLEQYIRL